MQARVFDARMTDDGVTYRPLPNGKSKLGAMAIFRAFSARPRRPPAELMHARRGFRARREIISGNAH